jgi:hypothetical protein
MIEEAEKNAALDKSKKSLVNVIYEFDNLLVKVDSIMNTMDFVNEANASARLFLLQIIKSMKVSYKQNQFKTIYIDLLEDLTYAHEVVLFDFVQMKIKQYGKSSKKRVIDITDDAIDV